MLVIGITGGTGVGKSTLLNVLEKKGAYIIDCDAVYHDMLRTSDEMTRAIKERFPEAYESGTLDTKALGSIVFEDAEALDQLKKITHPRIVSRVEDMLEKQSQKGTSLAAVDAYGLKESGLSDICDVTVAVTAPDNLRVRRIMARDGIDESYAIQRIRAQKSNEEYAAECDITLENNFASIQEFEKRCEEFINNIIMEG